MLSAINNVGFGPTQLSNAAATVYTVTTGFKLMLRCLLITNTSNSSATFTMSIGADAANKEIFTAVTIPANDFLSWDGEIIIASATIIQAFSGTASVLNITGGGVEFQ